MRKIPIIDATSPDVVVGRHAIWCPKLEVKIPFSFGGKLTKYGVKEAGYPAEDTLPHELAILRALAQHGMAPPVREPVWIETLITDYPGAWHADPCGAWGYEMADATKLPPGRFDFEAMRHLPIEGSPGAWGDVGKPGNVVNGYLVDVRRSAWDMLRWAGPLPRLQAPLEAVSILAERVHRECQFPAGERSQAYQEFYLDGEWRSGQRSVVERARLLGFTPADGESVLELGCQSGGFLQLAAMVGATAVGVEISPEYVDCARALARHARQNINIRLMDAVAERDVLLAWIRSLFPRGLDWLLCLSLEKHFGEADLLDLVDALGARRTIIETNAVGTSEPAPWKMRADIERRGGVAVGSTTDRNLRRVYRIERTP